MSSSNMPIDDSRAEKLKKYLHSIIHGRRALTPQSNVLFLEAIMAAPDAVACLNEILTSDKGLTSLQASMRFDISTNFFNNTAAKLLHYLSSADVTHIAGGTFLQPVLLVIVDPPIFWTPFRKAFQEGQLNELAQVGFAWLLHRLISLPWDQATLYRAVASDDTVLKELLSATSIEVRALAQKIKHSLSIRTAGLLVDADDAPGGRHDNDFANFRDISIVPTADELVCKESSFLRPSSALVEAEDGREGLHLDSQFRLLREDMLYEFREELLTVSGKKKRSHRGFLIDNLVLDGLYYETPNNRICKLGMKFKCSSDLWQFKKSAASDRQKFLDDNKNILRHQSMGCLSVDEEIVAFVTINRDEGLLAKKPPIIVLQLEGKGPLMSQTLFKLKASKNIRLIQIDTAVFSYEPILMALQQKQTLALAPELLYWKDGDVVDVLATQYANIARIVQDLRTPASRDLKSLLTTRKSVILDNAQAASLICALTQKVSLIQGPPGTGKSFIGALAAKVLHDYTSQTILVVCYTNHALDQFLEDLLDIGIPSDSLVRLGGKSTTRTAALSLQKQPKNLGSKLRKSDWTEINTLKAELTGLSNRLENLYRRYQSSVHPKAILEHLEFSYAEFYSAFEVPISADDMKKVDKTGRAIGPYYLLTRWMQGLNAGVLQNSPNVEEASEIWSMPRSTRDATIASWKQEILKELTDNIGATAQLYNERESCLNRKFTQREAAVLPTKRIIGCTTTGAAKYREDIDAAHADVLLVEEAGEILESHVLTAMGSGMQQLILIGDHKQLRPKVNNYFLTVEKGEGFDLNRSLFERLIIKGFPHETLCVQHRMRPEIAALVRELTYPELRDAPGTRGRPDLRGVRDNVVFIDHDKPEDDLTLEERRDDDRKASKRNKYEVQWVLKVLRYLAQQGYGTDKIVILTPYLGQLRELQQALLKDNDPVLNDLDSHDLVRAGLMTTSAAKVGQQKIRLATIDNYQGEESEIVIISLTRSNATNDIGFMYAQERLTVLLSRARDALIMIGNSNTFMQSRKGGEIWTKLFSILKRDGHIYNGLPVQCERHQSRKALLTCPEDFDTLCPDGGCAEPCGATLSCGLHPCPFKCHQISDHSKMTCEHIMYSKCPKGHSQDWKCGKGKPAICFKCDRDKRMEEKRKKEEFDLQEKRDAEQRSYQEQMAKLDHQIAEERMASRDAQIARDRQIALQQKEKDLDNIKELRKKAPFPIQNMQEFSSTQALSESAETNALPMAKSSQALQVPRISQPLAVPQQSPEPTTAKVLNPTMSSARKDWQHEKEVNGENNNAIDAIMDMTGLEDVKMQILRIKDKVDTSKRQGTTLAGERFNVSMLGNPGTGKTTVARHYGKFLSSVGVIPGHEFIETTGSRLANDGVPGLKKLLETLNNAGGGTLFVDEAYQLTSQHNFQGSQVLDFLLAEIENQVGKIVFIFAGYNKEMEKFFEHNPGLTSRVPYTLQFKDYEDAELLDMLENLVAKTYGGRMKVAGEGGIRGLFGRIAIRRLGRGRGKNGFGNARALANLFAKIRERQAQRLSRERRDGHQPDDFLLKQEDLIGPDPSKVMGDSKAWRKLQSMIGLGSVKGSIRNFFFMVDTNYKRELQELAPLEISLNRVFLGSPGTGKTTVAKYYGQILADLGLLSNSEVVIKNPADFIGSALGQSEAQTKAILANTIGKVLIIDEAYMLYGGSVGKGGIDPYKTAVIDTIVAEVQSVPGEDRCVLLLGYKEQLEEMFQNVNPGLARRFAIENAFHFVDYTDAELRQALDWKLKDQDLIATDAAKDVAVEVLNRRRNRPNFGNIGEVENLLSEAKSRHQSKQATLPMEQRSPNSPFEPQDFDPAFDRGEHAEANLGKLFENVVGCEDTVKKLSGWQTVSRNMKAQGMDPRGHIPTNFVFKGPPGTGKTTTARKMGQVFYDMGFLGSTEVIECSVSDLVGEYVGQTGPKVTQLFEKALGRVLFIDEAYRLGEGHFAKEAIDELVSILTQDKFRAKLIVVLAGYDQEMNELMAVNPGLSSRFPEEIVFHNLTPAQSLEVLRRKLRQSKVIVDALEDRSAAEYGLMIGLLQKLSRLPSWGNARDVETLSKKMISLVFSIPPAMVPKKTPDDFLTLAGSEAVTCMEHMLTAWRERSTNLPLRHNHQTDLQHELRRLPTPLDAPHIGVPETKAEITMNTTTPSELGKAKIIPSTLEDHRDAGVSDVIWSQLQADKKAMEDAEEHVRLTLKTHLEGVKVCEDNAQRALAQEKELETKLVDALEYAEREELMRRREKARLEHIAARAEQARRQAALKEEERKKSAAAREEARVQAKIREMGLCIAGFRWIKQANGYRCAGGSHFLDNASLGI